jgi:hypothetical protein
MVLSFHAFLCAFLSLLFSWNIIQESLRDFKPRFPARAAFFPGPAAFFPGPAAFFPAPAAFFPARRAFFGPVVSKNVGLRGFL